MTTVSTTQSGHATVNGLSYYYEIHGEGEPLLLLHGGLGSIDMFKPVLPALADHRRRPDVRLGFRSGPGLLSSALNGPFTFSPRSGQDRACRVVLLDGSDRWRSLLLGAPPLSA